MSKEIAHGILQAQLARMTKPRKNGWSYKDYPKDEVIFDSKGKPYAIKLNPKDFSRILHEIETLKNKIENELQPNKNKVQ